MWIVKLALRRPYTFVIMALLIMILGGISIVTMPVDIFPYIDIPILSIIYQYNGLSPEEMANRVVTGFERGLTTSVNDIEHIESQSYNGVAVIRVYFYPGARIELAQAQVVANAQSNLRGNPPGHVSAEHSEVRRFERAGSADRAGQPDDERVAVLRLR